MSVKFTCDWCGKETAGYYDCYEGWGGLETIEWWVDGKDCRESYHVNTFCAREYDQETKQWPEENCDAQFMRKNKIVRYTALKTNIHHWRYLQKDLEEKDLVYDKNGFYYQV